MPFYGVWAGVEPGIYEDWGECSKQIKGFKGAQYKKLKAKTKTEAIKEFKKGYQPKTKEIKEKDKKTSKEQLNKKQNLHEQNGVVMFCDGACQKNPGESGSGVSVFRDGKLIALKTGKYNKEGSNNIGELEALLYCLETMSKRKSSAVIYADSAYAINVVTKWSIGWSKNGWVKSDGKTIENKDLVIKCFNAYNKVKSQVDIKKVKAHIGELGNELADRMAIIAVKNKTSEWIDYEDRNIEEILKISY